jgi:hypothetical protein
MMMNMGETLMMMIYFNFPQITLAAKPESLIRSPSVALCSVKFDNGPNLNDVRHLLEIMQEESDSYTLFKVFPSSMLNISI